ncbi:hypothetical protein B0J13DRAFT_590375 [Dactylonectria estremocensis]|uniref:NAD(P)-binding protein n=1 Tax=Dactylonectria estremocensis TaxID=1079267 RepID=A0A9P9DC68_9HYPO|nr:hypothetical protein B0J13DRAFT_590375 [Dactylonectria estremocensis]
MASSKVAIITGGASGMGLAVAKHLSTKGWQINLFDLNQIAGNAATLEVKNSTFTAVDVTSWPSLSTAFDSVFKAQGRLDFVFANAGIIQMHNFYKRVDTLPPPELPQTSIDINLKAVIDTSYLAQHYFRANPPGISDAVLIMTASIAGFYAQEFNPLYSASKAGVVNFLRSIGEPFHKDSIRTYAICPGTARTNLLSGEVWDSWPEEYLTPIDTIVSTVDTMLTGGAITDANGRRVEKGADHGLAVEVFQKNFYFRDQMDFINEGMRKICEASSLDRHQSHFDAGRTQ